MNLATLLDGLPDVAVHTVGAEVPRDELSASAQRLGELLAESGLATGQVVAAMLPNEATTIAALFGTWRAGGVYTPLNPRAADPEILAQLQTLRPVAIITTPALAQRFSTHHLPVITGEALLWTRAASSGHPADGPCYDDDVALLQFTSGTTGPPKPVPLRHSTVLDLIDRLLAKLRGTKPGLENASAPPKRPPCRIWCPCPCRCGPASTRCCSRSGPVRASC